MHGVKNRGLYHQDDPETPWEGCPLNTGVVFAPCWQVEVKGNPQQVSFYVGSCNRKGHRFGRCIRATGALQRRPWDCYCGFGPTLPVKSWIDLSDIGAGSEDGSGSLIFLVPLQGNGRNRARTCKKLLWANLVPSELKNGSRQWWDQRELRAPLLPRPQDGSRAPPVSKCVPLSAPL